MRTWGFSQTIDVVLSQALGHEAGVAGVYNRATFAKEELLLFGLGWIT